MQTIYAADASGRRPERAKPVMISREKSDWLARVLLIPSCRPYTIECFPGSAKSEHALFRVERGYVTTCCCHQRPSAAVYSALSATTFELIGRVAHPCLRCRIGISVLGPEGTLRYQIVSRCCRASVLCHQLPCQGCQETSLDVLDARTTVCGRVLRLTKGCLQSSFQRVNDYSLVFPKQCSALDKVLLIQAVSFLSFQQFKDCGCGF